MNESLGMPFPTVEAGAIEVLNQLGTPLVIAANEPPWSRIEPRLGTRVASVVEAWDMDENHLGRAATQIASQLPEEVLTAATVVGIGGGTALDTAKFLAWTLGRPLVQVPTITSVDAGFTDAIGVRREGRVRYVGKLAPMQVVIDMELIRSAPPRLNRAGIGDVLSCHTGLHDWRLASDHGDGPAWDSSLAALGESLLRELDDAVDEIAVVSEHGVRFLVDAYRRIGAACAVAGHSRFEEGSEHFWAYAYEHATGDHHVHGELISFAVCALAHVQGNDPDRAMSIVRRSQVRANPADLGISFEAFAGCLADLTIYARAEGLDMSVADYAPIGRPEIDRAWAFVETIPRQT